MLRHVVLILDVLDFADGACSTSMRRVERGNDVRYGVTVALFALFTASNKVWDKAIFLQACGKNSVLRGVCLWCRGCQADPLWQTPPWANTPRADIPRKTPPAPSPPSTKGYGQEAGGTHPTGMHSCRRNILSGGSRISQRGRKP